jgi:L-2-hydroxyglutarate oxidase LhgO
MSGTDFDAIIVGAGVIGLAVARALALSGRSVLIVERAAQIGTETSARNSEVIHGGIYYPPGSLKARLCVAGKAELYAFCEENGVPFRKCGKLVVAANEAQTERLEAMQAGARGCGVEDLRLLGANEARRMEPDIACAGALFSPSTGIIDTHSYMQALLGAAEANDAILACNTAVVRIDRAPDGWALVVDGEDAPVASARTVVNAAGLAAGDIAGKIEGFPGEHVPRLHFAKGSYFSYAGRTSFSHLVYPLPEPGGLGIHLTLDMSGRARFGPDVEWVDRIDYAVDPGRRDRFASSIRRYWPGIDANQLHPDYAGIRPKLSGPGEDAADFAISGPADHGVSGIVNLFGIESPGITASLAIADRVAKEVALAA